MDMKDWNEISKDGFSMVQWLYKNLWMRRVRLYPPPLMHSVSAPGETCPARCRPWNCHYGHRFQLWYPGGCSWEAPQMTHPWRKEQINTSRLIWDISTHTEPPTFFVSLWTTSPFEDTHKMMLNIQAQYHHTDTHLGFSWVSIRRMTSSIQSMRSRTILKKRNLSPVSSSRARRPSQASRRLLQASSTSPSRRWMSSALSPAYADCRRTASSCNCLTWGHKQGAAVSKTQPIVLSAFSQ